MKIGLAQVPFPKSIEDGIEIVKRYVKKSSEEECNIVCFPEAMIPGLRGVGLPVEKFDQQEQSRALDVIREYAALYKVFVILPMEWEDHDCLQQVAFVISDKGELMGCQTKNQIPLDEEDYGYVPGKGRKLFYINNIPFGIVICHEGWRYPETVRWAAQRGAKIVFHPQFTGDVGGSKFFDNAMVCRSMENSIYFASINYSLEEQGSCTSLVSPLGELLAYVVEGKEALLVFDIDIEQSTGLLAKRFNPNVYVEI